MKHQQNIAKSEIPHEIIIIQKKYAWCEWQNNIYQQNVMIAHENQLKSMEINKNQPKSKKSKEIRWQSI